MSKKLGASRIVANIKDNLDALIDLSAQTESIEKNLIQNILELIAAENSCLLRPEKLDVLKRFADKQTRYDSRRDITDSGFHAAYLEIRIGPCTEGVLTLVVFSHEVGHLIDCYVYNHPHPRFPEWIERTAQGDETAFHECYDAIGPQQPSFEQKEKEELIAYMVSLGVADACGYYDAARQSLWEDGERNGSDPHAEPKRLLFEVGEHYPPIDWIDKARRAMHLSSFNPDLDVRALAAHVLCRIGEDRGLL